MVWTTKSKYRFAVGGSVCSTWVTVSGLMPASRISSREYPVMMAALAAAAWTMEEILAGGLRLGLARLSAAATAAASPILFIVSSGVIKKILFLGSKIRLFVVTAKMNFQSLMFIKGNEVFVGIFFSTSVRL